MNLKTAILLAILVSIAGLFTADFTTNYRKNKLETAEKIESLDVKTRNLQNFELQVRQLLQRQTQKIQSLELKVLQLQFHTGYSSIPEAPPIKSLSEGVITTK